MVDRRVPVRTYIDAGVLIAAFHGDEPASAAALSFLFDPLRDYATSDYVTIERLPKCTYFKRTEEWEFYDEFFKRTVLSVSPSPTLMTLALQHGGWTGISGIDALHVTAALTSGGIEFITSERPTKPIHRAKGIRVISINPLPPAPRALSLCERFAAFIVRLCRMRDTRR